MEKKNIDWENIGFGYIPTDKRFVANYKDGAWDEGGLTEDPNIVMNECAWNRTHQSRTELCNEPSRNCYSSRKWF